MSIKMQVITDVAFNENVTKVIKHSFKKTIDVQFGIYKGYTENGYQRAYDGWLTINLKPSSGWKDWFINLFAIPKKILCYGCIHRGYWKECLKWWDNADKYGASIHNIIYGNEQLNAARKKGVIIAGRSKGAAEAVIIAWLFNAYHYCSGIPILVGAIEPPMMCSADFARAMENELGADNIHWTSYNNDIVTGLPRWFTVPGVKHQYYKRGLGLSFKDHRIATTHYELMKSWAGF